MSGAESRSLEILCITNAIRVALSAKGEHQMKELIDAAKAVRTLLKGDYAICRKDESPLGFVDLMIVGNAIDKLYESISAAEAEAGRMAALLNEVHQLSAFRSDLKLIDQVYYVQGLFKELKEQTGCRLIRLAEAIRARRRDD